MSVMNPGLEQIYRELENDFSWLVHKWHEFNELYARGQERIDLLNSVASNFFYFLNKLLFEDAMLHLCRLTDPPRSCGRDTLSVMRLAEEVTDPTLKVAVQNHAEHARKTCEFARDWRNQVIAHTDLESLRTGQAVVLPQVKAPQVEDAIKSVGDVLAAIETHYKLPHSVSMRDPWGAKALIGYLAHSKKLREQELAGWKQAVRSAERSSSGQAG